MSLFKKENQKKSDVVPGSQNPNPIDVSKLKFMFTGQEVDLILNYLSKRPWAEVTNLMDMVRMKLAQTKITNEKGEKEGINVQVNETKEGN
jgi:hypothetical protein